MLNSLALRSAAARNLSKSMLRLAAMMASIGVSASGFCSHANDSRCCSGQVLCSNCGYSAKRAVCSTNACAVALISANFASLAVCSCCAACSTALSLFNFHAPLIQSWHSSGRGSRVKLSGSSPTCSIVTASPVSVLYAV